MFEREGESPKQLCTVSTEHDVGLELTNGEIMTWAKTKSQTRLTDWVTQAPQFQILKEF